MQLLVLCFHYPPDLTAGAFRVAALVDALSAQRSAHGRIHVVTGDRIRRPARPAPGAAGAAAEAGNVVVHRGAPGRIGRWLPAAVVRYAFRAWRVARRQAPAVVVGSSSKLGTALLAALVAAGCGARLHLDFRDLFTDHLRSLLPAPAGRSLRLLLLPLKRWAVGRAATVSATNAVQARYLRRYFGARCTVIPNGIEPAFYADPPGVDARTTDDDRLRVLYAGNLGRAQALHRVLPALAAATADSACWRVIGNGPRAGELQRAVERQALANVELLAPVPRQALPVQYRWADVLFLHLKAAKSSRRVVPSKIFEYAVTGKPIVAGVAGISRDLLQREVDGAYCFSPENVSEALAHLGKIKRIQYKRDAFRARYDRGRLARELAAVILEGG